MHGRETSNQVKLLNDPAASKYQIQQIPACSSLKIRRYCRRTVPAQAVAAAATVTEGDDRAVGEATEAGAELLLDEEGAEDARVDYLKYRRQLMQ